MGAMQMVLDSNGNPVVASSAPAIYGNLLVWAGPNRNLQSMFYTLGSSGAFAWHACGPLGGKSSAPLL